MTKEDRIKILIVSHKPFRIPEGDCFVPIHAGRAVALTKSKDGAIDKDDLDWLLKNTIGDDTGDNISDKNRFYSECSAIYWAWKNYDKLGNPDYIGLMHYRRHFIFNEEYFSRKKKCYDEQIYKLAYEESIYKDYTVKIGLDDGHIERVCQDYDLVVSKYTDFTMHDNCNLRDDYSEYIEGTKAKDFDLMVETVLKMYPSYENSLKKHINGYAKLSFNMFVMKKELFFEYCEFLFNILFYMEKQIDFSTYSTNGKRTLGYIAEILLTIFVWKLEEDSSRKILKLGITKIDYPYSAEQLKKLMPDNHPHYTSYLFNKFKYLTAQNTLRKERLKQKYKAIRDSRKEYKKRKRIYKILLKEN